MTMAAFSLAPEEIEALADALAPRVAALVVVALREEGSRDGQRWMTSAQASAYLGLPSTNALHKLTSARQIPFEQDRPHGKLYFDRHELDRWRKGAGAKVANIRAA